MTSLRSLRLALFTAVAALSAFGANCSWAQSGAADAEPDQVLVFLRHAEKPEQGLGQLTCQGLNRSLALPSVLAAKFGTPASIFAPNPGELKDDKGVDYNYVRPLATIEPTAIRMGLPVHATHAYTDVFALEQSLLVPAQRHSTVFIAWEHHLARLAVENIVTHLAGDAKTVPAKWDDSDFDSLYVLRIHWVGNKAQSVTFEHDAQGLNGLSKQCPA